MDLSSLLEELHFQKTKCEEAIALVESLQKAAGQRDVSLDELQKTAKIGIRGRKFMGDDERREVSARMKAYWAKRRTGTDEEAENASAVPSMADPNAEHADERITEGRVHTQQGVAALVVSH